MPVIQDNMRGDLGTIGSGVRPLPVPPAEKPLTRAVLDSQQAIYAETYSRLERALRFDFNTDQGKWVSRDVSVRLARGAFDRGYQRICFRMQEFATPNPAQSDAGEEMVAKFLDKGVLEPLVGPLNKEMYFNDVKCQAEAVKYCDLFNSKKPPQPIWFSPGHVLQFLERPGKPYSACEPMMEGHFVKHNNNNGHVLSQRQTPQAYSHFTYEYSGGKIVICDIQGVDNKFTDPQVHSENSGYGLGNQGREGIRKFLKSHTCNGVCLALGLPRMLNGKRGTDWSQDQKDAVRAAIRGPSSEEEKQQQQPAVKEPFPAPVKIQEVSSTSTSSTSYTSNQPRPTNIGYGGETPSAIHNLDLGIESTDGSSSASTTPDDDGSSVHSGFSNQQKNTSSSGVRRHPAELAVSSSSYTSEMHLAYVRNQSASSNSSERSVPSTSTASTTPATAVYEEKENVDVSRWVRKIGFVPSAEGALLLQRIESLEQKALEYMRNLNISEEELNMLPNGPEMKRLAAAAQTREKRSAESTPLSPLPVKPTSSLPAPTFTKSNINTQSLLSSPSKHSLSASRDSYSSASLSHQASADSRVTLC